MTEESDGGLASDPASRARAIQSLLIEWGLLSTEAIDAIVSQYEEDVGPLDGARLVVRAWRDSEFRDHLLEDGLSAMSEFDIQVNDEVLEVDVVENTPTVHNVIVCTLCSCYPWSVLGLPPTWYKSPAYRSRIVREPRTLLREEFDLRLDGAVEIEVWDSTSERRYMVLPQQPPGTDDWSEEDLLDIVTRDAMIGVERLGDKPVARAP